MPKPATATKDVWHVPPLATKDYPRAPKVEQQPLAKAVCAERHGAETCTLLTGHQGKHTSSHGRQW